MARGRMGRKASFTPPVIEPPNVKVVSEWELHGACPSCGFGPMIGIMNEDMSEEDGTYCSGCNTQFKIKKSSFTPEMTGMRFY